MSRLDELPPDQRAALSLLLRQGKSYGEVALLLGIAESAVHDRAHAALAVLAPQQARSVPAERRAQVGDYLLGQQDSAAQLATRGYLAGAEPARAFAQALAGELAPLAGELPEIPSGQPGAPAQRRPSPAPASATDAADASATAPASSSPPGPSLRSSRLGGALVLAALAAAVVVAVVLLTTGGGSSSKRASSTRATTGTTGKTGPTISAQLPLRPVNASSHAVGVVAVLTENSKRAFYIEAQNLPATRNFFYAIWLYNSPSSAQPLSRAPAVGATHRLAGGAALPANAGEFREILLTRETNSRPTHPGSVVLRGAFSLG